MFLWLLLLVSAVLFFVAFWNMPMFPRLWSFLVLGFLAIVLGIMWILSYRSNAKSHITRFLDVVLCLCLAIGSFLMPNYTDKISNLFSSVVGQIVTINFYVMASNSDNIDDYYGSTFITETNADSENQSYAVSQMNTYYGTQLNTIDRESAVAGAASLYNGEGSVLILTSGYESMIESTEGYENFETDTKIIYSVTRKIESTLLAGDSELTSKPFIIFFGGNDEEGQLSLVGHTDVDMAVVVNPNTHQIAIINVPRDAYIANPAYDGEKDKLTHLGLKGIDNTLTGLSDYLQEDINNYVLVNFTTFKIIIDALDGVTIDNPYEFTTYYCDVTYPKGEITLDGESALLYVRERYNLPNGDFDRAEHQQIVMKAIIHKLTSADMITHFDELLTSLQNNFLTNLSSDSIYALCRKQLSENISWNIVNYHVTGDTGMGICASAPGQELSIVYPYENQVEFVRNVIDQIYAGETITQQIMPEGESSYSYE